jgi:hypothetical protein
VRKAGGNAGREKWFLFVIFMAVWAKKAGNFDLNRGRVSET